MHNPENVWRMKMTGTNGFIVAVLVLVVIALGERALYDAVRVFVGSEQYDYFDDLATILIHAVMILPFFAASIVLNVFIGEYRQKYAIMLAPYFIASSFFALQLALQISVYFAYHHTQAQFYVVMLLLTAISSVAIYFIQERFNRHLENS